ncbi:unnamed protein product [Malus baccata var. baccata]
MWIELLSDYDCTIEYHPCRANVVVDALSRKPQGRINALYACHVPLFADLRSTGVKLGVEKREEALLDNFQVRPILIDRVLEAQMNDEEIQELIEARNQGKKKDLRIQETDGVLMQENKMMAFQEAFGSRLLYNLMEFTYNNSYHSSIGMSPFEALYGKSCRTTLYWSKDRHKSLADKHATDRVYKLGDWVFLKLSPWRGVVRFRKKDPSHVIPPQPLEINLDLTYDEEPVTILDGKDKVLRNKTVRLVRILWKNHSVEEATWETEECMNEMYPHLFYGY